MRICSVRLGTARIMKLGPPHHGRHKSARGLAVTFACQERRAALGYQMRPGPLQTRPGPPTAPNPTPRVTESTLHLHLRARFGTSTHALIVDGHGTARQMPASQLRAMDASQVVQCAKALEARQPAAARPFNIVLCEPAPG